MAYGQVNADVIGTSVAGSNLGAGNASLMKSRIINGAMVIDQRNAGASFTPTANNQYTLDRWVVYTSQSSKFNVQQNAGSVTPPVGFKNYLGVTSLSAYSVTSTDFFNVFQKIEGLNTYDLAWGTANAKTVTLSFQVYSSLTGTFGGVISNGAENYTYPFTYSVPTANTWTTISVTITGATSGTWQTNASVGLEVSFSLGVGSTYSGTAGSWSGSTYYGATGATSVVGTSGATFYITGVQLEVGSSATGYEYVNYQTSLANCQRYYFKNKADIANAGLGGVGAFGSTTTLAAVHQYPVPMRSSPTASQSGCSIANGIASQSVSAISTSYYGTSSATVQYIGGAIFTGGQGGYLFGPSTSAYVDFSAEL